MIEGGVPLVPHQIHEGKVANSTETWLRKRHNLLFNPFVPLRAEDDPRLWMYWVGDEDIFRIAWEPGGLILLAPWGGGKSAFRVRLTQECWTSPVDHRPFPIVYLPGGAYLEVEEHLQDLTANGTRELLLALGRYPRRFLESSEQTQKGFASFLGRVSEVLPIPIMTLLMEMEDQISLTPLNRPYDPGYDIEIPREERGELYKFCASLSSFVPRAEQSRNPFEHWEELIFWIRELLHRPSVYVLVDGLDAWPETASDMEGLLNTLKPLLELSSAWYRQGCFLKIFLPSAVSDVIRDSGLVSNFQIKQIFWSKALLLQVLQRRMVAASRGQMNGLAVLAEPALADLDLRLIEAIEPLPRELLFLINSILSTHAQSDALRLNRMLVEQTIAEYQREK